MAKKKSHSHPAANGAAPTEVATDKDASMRSVSLDRSESLKVLNGMLLKETVERREQVSQLQSELERLAGDADVLSLIEREVGRLVVSSGLSEVRAADLDWAAAVRGSLDAERLAAAEVKRRMEVAVFEKAEIESSLARALSERDSAVATLSESKRGFELQELAAKEEADRLMQLLEGMRDELGLIEAEKVSLEERLKISEASVNAANDQLVLAEREKNELVGALDQAISEKAKNQNDIATMAMTLRETQDKLANQEALVIDLQKQKEAAALALQEAAEKLTEKTLQFEVRIRELENKKGQLEEQKAALSRECERLKADTESLKLVALEKENLESELESTHAALMSANWELERVSEVTAETKRALESVVSERDAKQSQLAEKIKEVQTIKGELEMIRLELFARDNEKERLQIDMESLKAEFMDELATLRTKLETLEQEKASADELKGKQVTEIADLSSQVTRLLARESELQERHEKNIELSNRLQDDIESAQRNVQLHKAEAHGLKLHIEELTKNKEDTAQELQRVKAELDDLVVESDQKGIQIDALAGEKAKLERELADTRLAFAEMEGQARTAKVNLNKALSLLRSTSEHVSALEEGKGQGSVVLGRDVAAEERELDADVHVFAKDLKAIRAAFESGVAKKAHMSREMNLLQEAVAAAEAQNDKLGMWSWLSPAASSLVAVASLAYAATVKGR